MEGLGTGGDIGCPRRHSSLVGETIMKGHILCMIPLFGSSSHFGVGFNADHTVGTVCPDDRRDARSTAEINDQTGTFRLRQLRQDLEEGGWWCGTVDIVTIGKPAAGIARAFDVELRVIGLCTHRRCSPSLPCSSLLAMACLYYRPELFSRKPTTCSQGGSRDGFLVMRIPTFCITPIEALFACVVVATIRWSFSSSKA